MRGRRRRRTRRAERAGDKTAEQDGIKRALTSRDQGSEASLGTFATTTLLMDKNQTKKTTTDRCYQRRTRGWTPGRSWGGRNGSDMGVGERRQQWQIKLVSTEKEKNQTKLNEPQTSKTQAKQNDCDAPFPRRRIC